MEDNEVAQPAPRREVTSSTKSKQNKFDANTNTIQILKSSAADVIVREVHDYELDVLTEGDQSDLKSLAFTCLGTSFGFLQNFIELVSETSKGKPSTLGQLAATCVFVLSVSVGLTSWFQSRRRRSVSLTKKTEIRARELLRVAGPLSKTN